MDFLFIFLKKTKKQTLLLYLMCKIDGVTL